MSTTFQLTPVNQISTPAERIRLMGRKMGLWNQGYDFARLARQLFRDIDFRNKTMLEIGCGKGMLCLWAAAHGARHVVGLEPLADGAYHTSECHQAFRKMTQQLELPQARILPDTVQKFDCPSNYFDVVLSVASINHLDEKSCVALGKSEAAENEYRKIFRDIARMMKPGGKPISMEQSRRRSWPRHPTCLRRRRSSNESRCSARNCRSRLDPEHSRTSWRPADCSHEVHRSRILRREGVAASPLVTPGSA